MHIGEKSGRSKWWLPWLASAGALFGYACGNERADERIGEQQAALTAAETKIFSITLPAGVPLDSAVLAGSGAVVLSDRSQVLGATGAPAPIYNSGPQATASTTFGADAKGGTVVSRPKIALSDRSRIEGDALSSVAVQSTNLSVIMGAVRSNVAPSFDRWSWSVTFPSASQSISVSPDTTQTVAPGAFEAGNVYSRATLRLRTGTYYFNSLAVEPQAKLAVDTTAGPIVIYVKSSFTWRGVVYATGPPDRLLLGYAGTSAPAIEMPLSGTVVAPFSSVRLAVGGASHVGAVFARDVQLDPGVSLVGRAFSGWGQVPFACQDQAGLDACASQTSCVGSTCSATQALPVGLGPFNAAVVAGGQLSVGEDTVIESANMPPAVIVNAGSGSTTIGSRARVGSIWSGGSVALGDSSVATGYIATLGGLTRSPTAEVFGQSKTGQASFQLESFKWLLSVPSGSSDVIVTATRQLPAGAYRNVRVLAGATLDLLPGRYDFESLTVDAGAKMKAQTDVRLNVRTNLRLDGQVVRSGELGGTVLFLSYFGTRALEIRDTFDGSIFTPVTAVHIANGVTFRGTLYASAVAVGANGLVRWEPPAKGAGVGLVGGAADPYSSRIGPVDVYTDNPDLTGAFTLDAAISADQQGPYSHIYHWQGVSDAFFTDQAYVSDQASSPLFSLSGGLPYDGSPLAPAAGLPTRARFRYRGTTLIHQNTYAYDARMQLSGAAGPFQLNTLWLRLSPEVVVVPLIVVAWDDPGTGRSGVEIRDQLVTTLDFLPSSIGHVPTSSGDTLDPTRFNGEAQVPPDDIWRDCLIQFRVIRALVLPKPERVPPCGSQFHNFVDGYDTLVGLISAAVPDQAQAWFGENGLRPGIIEAGPLSLCNQFSGNTIKANLTVELNTANSIWDSDDATTIAHELGHMLSLNHRGSTGEGNLMAMNAGATDRNLSEAECHTAWSFASGYRKKLRDYDVSVGAASSVVSPLGDATGRLLVPERDRGPRVCCNNGDKLSWVDRLSCLVLGGSVTDPSECSVCCAVNDPATRDSGGAFNISRIAPDQCSTDRVLDSAQCDPVCCVRDGAGHKQTRYQCLASNAAAGVVAGRIAIGDEAETLCPPDKPK